MSTDRRPSILRVIMTNYIAFLAVFIPVILWVFFIVDVFRGEVLTSSEFSVLGGITIAGLVIALWKMISIFTIINYGQEENAVIQSSGFFRGRGTIKFIYTYQGEKYITQNTTLKNKHTSVFAAGDQVKIFVNPNKPENAVLMDIYTK
jgi:hypothetical protein